MKRSISASHNISKAENDLISVFSSSVSNSSTPTTAEQQTPNSVSSNFKRNVPPLTANNSYDRYAALSEIFSNCDFGDVSKTTNGSDLSYTSRTSSNGSSIMSRSMPPPLALPRPSSIKYNHTSPQLPYHSMSRCESIGSLSNDFRMTPLSFTSSRGPSPLTLGISDIIPIAVAFQESVNAYFKGSNETKCQVQSIGSLKIAFPSKIVQVRKQTKVQT